MSAIIQLGVSAFITAISIVITIILSVKAKKKGNTIESAAKLSKLFEIVKKLPVFINEAETIFGVKTGLAKINYVLNKTQMECIKNSVNFEESYFSTLVEQILSTPQKKEI